MSRSFLRTKPISVLSYHGIAHTDSDIVVDLPEDDVVFLGDLVEEGAPPAFGDSYPEAWPETLRRGFVPRRAVVPGHGRSVDAAFVAEQLEELEEVASLAREVVAGEVVVDVAAAKGPYSPDVMRAALGRALEVSG